MPKRSQPWMSYDAFADLVFGSLDALPGDILALLDNVQVVVEDWPTPQQLRGLDLPESDSLLGLYEGIPMTERGAQYDLVLPDKISLFRGTILELCESEAEVAEEVRITVIHELAHHFGIDDARLEELGAY